MRNLLRAYGKHVWTIEASLIIITSLVLFAEIRFAYVSIAYGPSLLAFLVLASVHVFICARIATLELYPHETLRLNSFHLRFYRLLFLSVLIAFLLLYVVFKLFPNEFSAGNIFVGILTYYAFTAFALLFSFFLYSSALMTDHKKTRLSFRTTLVGLKLISMENSENGRDKLIRKHIRWLKDGLRSYNRYLYKQSPARIEIVDIDGYYHSLCCVALMGSRQEIDVISEQTRFALGSLRRSEKWQDDVRHFLIRLKNIKNLERREDYPLNEINDMTRILSFSERLKTILTSPYLAILIAIIPIVLQLWSLITSLGWQF